MLCIPKILKNESNSQLMQHFLEKMQSCCVSQRYWKMKAIHNCCENSIYRWWVVVYPKDTEKWKQFTTCTTYYSSSKMLLCIPKILKNESNSQHTMDMMELKQCCCVSQRYWKMKAIHNTQESFNVMKHVVVYPKDTEKWKQFTTDAGVNPHLA